LEAWNRARRRGTAMGCCASTEAAAPPGAQKAQTADVSDVDVSNLDNSAKPASEQSGPGSARRRMTDTSRRRIAVRAETQDDIGSSNYSPQIYAKSDAEKKRIFSCIEQSDLLKGLTSAQVDILVNAFFLVDCEAGDPIIKEGEEGDHFYMVDSGKYEVFLKSVGTSPIKTYSTGDSFGELALLYNSLRAATVKCVEAGGVWALERKAFRHVVVNTGEQEQGKATNFLKAVPILSPLTDDQRQTLAACMEELPFADGEYVVQTGEPADALYFIKAGEVVCHIEEDGKKKELMRLTEGGVFGESCLEKGADPVRKANVVAVGNVRVLKLTAAVFLEQLGELAEVATKNFKRKVMETLSISDTRIWAQLAPEDQDALLNQLQEKEVKDGTDIIKQGEANSTFYIIKSGSAKVLQAGSDKTPRELAVLNQGQFFGERALLTDEPASATIKASGTTALYVCDRATFTAVFGPMQSLIDAEIKRRDDAGKRPVAPDWADLEMRRLLGVGTFGRVKLVIHKPTDKSYALKCMRKAQVVQTKQQQHVMHEKKILSQMEHPFILALVATYQDAGELYMLLEVALGGELFSLLAKRAPLPDAHARFYSAQVVSIFSYMHGLKIVYRDLKPENLLIDPSGYIKMVDFGFAKVLNERTWTLCGTPEYLAPEIILNKGHGFGADWWCVGILTFECLTGATPFVSNDPMDGYRKIIKCRVPWPVSISSITRDFIDKLLVVEASKRLGCLRGGSLDVRSHPWFSGLDFKKLEAKKVPAPFVPKIKSHKDDSNFQYFEDDGIRNFPQSNFPRDMFSEFASVWVNE